MKCSVDALQCNEYNCLNNYLITYICFLSIRIDRLYSSVSMRYKSIDQMDMEYKITLTEKLQETISLIIIETFIKFTISSYSFKQIEKKPCKMFSIQSSVFYKYILNINQILRHTLSLVQPVWLFWSCHMVITSSQHQIK